jgi:hypothetical protein
MVILSFLKTNMIVTGISYECKWPPSPGLPDFSMYIQRTKMGENLPNGKNIPKWA